MSRTDLNSTTIASFNNTSVNVAGKITYYPTRLWVSAVNTANIASFATSTAGIPTTPLCQDGKIYEIPSGSTAGDVTGLDPDDVYKFVGIFNQTGKLHIAANFTGTRTLQTGGVDIATTRNTRPSIAFGIDDFYLFYSTGNVVTRAALRIANYFNSNTTAVGEIVAASTTFAAKPSVHALGQDEHITLWVDDGGVRVSYYNETAGSWVGDDWQGRFMHPETVYTDAANAKSLNFSGAVKNSTGNIFVYFSSPDGNVLGVERSANGNWSESFEAVPSDISKFAVANAFIDQSGQIRLNGQLQRYDETGSYTSTYVYNLLLVSRDGRRFSLDRATAYHGSDTAGTSLAYRYIADDAPDLADAYSVAGSGIVFSDANRYAVKADHWGLDNSIAGTDIDVIDISGNLDTWRVIIPNEKGTYDSTFTIGDLLELYGANLNAGGTYTYFMMQRCVITGISKTFAQGKRGLTLDVKSLASAKASMMTHPFGFELRSKKSLYDNLATMDNLFEADETGFLATPFSVDMWSAGVVEPGTHGAQASTEYTTADLLSALELVSYPEIETLPIDIYMYGWSRSGNPTPYTGGTGDQPSDLDSFNDLIACKIYVTQADGTETSFTTTTIAPSGTYRNFPQTWYNTTAGDYPVILRANSTTGLTVGDLITKVGFIFSNTYNSTSTTTVFYPERVQIPDVSMRLKLEDLVFEETTEEFSPCDFEYISNFGCTVTNAYTWTNEGTNWDNMYFRLRAPHTYKTQDQLYVKLKCISGTSITAKLMSTTSIGYLPTLTNDTSGAVFNAGDEKYIYGTKLATTHDITDGEYFQIQMGFDKAGSWEITEIGAYDDTDTSYVVLWDQAGTCPEAAEELTGQELVRFGIPVVYYSNEPYWAFNFEVAARYYINGGDAYGGVVGLGSDGENYVAARANPASIDLIKVRGGVTTVLSTTAYTFPDIPAWILLSHRDGRFQIRVRRRYGWSAALIDYEWTEADGQLATDKDILHLGIYSLKDTPWTQICSFDPVLSTKIGVLPGPTGFDDFTASGQVRIEGNIYSYSATQKLNSTDIIQGPFQGRNSAGDYSYTNDGQAYSGKATEITRFEWVDNAANVDDFDDYLQATDNGVAWEVTDVDYKPFIFTDGVQVFLKNRGRFFSGDVSGNLIGKNVRVWLTEGITGVSQVSGEDGIFHASGELMSQWGAATVKAFGYTASSGEEDAVDADMIGYILALADAPPPVFDGDLNDTTQALSSTAWKVQNG